MNEVGTKALLTRVDLIECHADRRNPLFSRDRFLRAATSLTVVALHFPRQYGKLSESRRTNSCVVLESLFQLATLNGSGISSYILEARL